MSTRSHIIVKVPSEPTNFVYHHCDGYLTGVGADLKDFIKNEYQPVTFTGEEFCSQLEDWDNSYEYENSGPHGDEEYIYTIKIDKNTKTIEISAEQETYHKDSEGEWQCEWEPCNNFSESIELNITDKMKDDYIPECSYGKTPLTREYFEKNNWKISTEKIDDEESIWVATLNKTCDDCFGRISLQVSNCMYPWRFSMSGEANGYGEGYFHGQIFVCTVEELETFLFDIVHIGWDYRTNQRIHE